MAARLVGQIIRDPAKGVKGVHGIAGSGRQQAKSDGKGASGPAGKPTAKGIRTINRSGGHDSMVDIRSRIDPSGYDFLDLFEPTS